MSGIVGIVNLDGAAVDERLLSRMTASMVFRGPDAQQTWVAGLVGFGHTLLKTTYESEHEQQPFSFDHHTFIVADCRIDAREELVAQLKAKNRPASLDRPDVELILHAWHVWGEDCVQHLLGDFSFAIWDSSSRRLFCARDHMGVKPFYYAHIGPTVAFSNTLDCVRIHSAVSDDLNQLAIADFLLFGLNREKDTTSFADIRCVEPGHVAIWTEGRLSLRRYWTLPIDEPLYYRRNQDYVDRFNDLLRTVVNDRLRVDSAGVFMSGGIDSPTLAAAATEAIRKRTGSSGVHAFTNVAGDTDEERPFAEAAAQLLGVLHTIRDGSTETDSVWDVGLHHSCEPIYYPMGLPTDRAHFAKVATHSRVAFHGEGPDNALGFEWQAYVARLIKSRQHRRLVRELVNHAFLHRRVPLLSTIHHIVAARRSNVAPYFPTWLNPDFEARLNLKERWREAWVTRSHAQALRPLSQASFDSPLWQKVFGWFDAANTRALLEVRHPFVDLRMMRFLLAIPTVPWCRRKYLIRRAMRGKLPVALLKRFKTAARVDSVFERIRRSGIPPCERGSEMEDYVRVDLLPRHVSEDAHMFWADFRARSLSYWLQDIRQRALSLN